MWNFKPIFYNRYCNRTKEVELNTCVVVGSARQFGLSFIVNIILNDIIWELAVKFVTVVLFINITIKIHSICSSNTLCTGLYFLWQTEKLNGKLKFIWSYRLRWCVIKYFLCMFTELTVSSSEGDNCLWRGENYARHWNTHRIFRSIAKSDL